MITPIIPPAPRVRLEDLYKNDPVLRERVAAEKKEAQAAINTLKQSRIDLTTQRKDMAMQRVQRIKASIKALRMAGIVDPKVLARMAAQLAKELASAVKEFIAAGGKPDLVNALSDTGKTGAEINATSGIEGESAETPVEIEDSAHMVEAVEQELRSSSEAVAQQEAQEAEAAAQKYESTQNLEKEAAPKIGQDSEKDGDKAFFDSVREAAEELRKILRGYKRVMDAYGKKQEPEFRQAEDALREVDRLVSAPAFNPPSAQV
jgi:hypothetical protein